MICCPRQFGAVGLNTRPVNRSAKLCGGFVVCFSGGPGNRPIEGFELQEVAVTNEMHRGQCGFDAGAFAK